MCETTLNACSRLGLTCLRTFGIFVIDLVRENIWTAISIVAPGRGWLLRHVVNN